METDADSWALEISSILTFNKLGPIGLVPDPSELLICKLYVQLNHYFSISLTALSLVRCITCSLYGKILFYTFWAMVWRLRLTVSFFLCSCVFIPFCLLFLFSFFQNNVIYFCILDNRYTNFNLEITSTSLNVWLV
jgi:hypothetical protein